MGAAIIPAVIGAVASIGGSFMQANAQKAAVEAQNQAQQAAMQRQMKARQEEDARQEQMRLAQQAEADKSLSTQDVGSVTDQLDKTKAESAAPVTAIANSIAQMSPGEVAVAARPGTAQDTTIVQNDLGQRLNQAAAHTRDYLQAKSNLGAWDTMFGNRGRQLGDVNENLNFINKKRTGSLATAEIGIDQLGQSYAGSIVPNSTAMALGSAAGGLGDIVSKYGGYG